MNTAPNPPITPGAESGRIREDRIRAIAAKIADDAQIPGISIAVADPTGVRYAGAVGYADLASRRAATPEDQYLWFSMTKIATATTAMRLHAERVPRPRRPDRHLPARLPTAPQARAPHHPAAAHPHRGTPQPDAGAVGPPREPASRPGPAGAPGRQARHPAQASRWPGLVLQHRLPPGGRGHRGRHRAPDRGMCHVTWCSLR